MHASVYTFVETAVARYGMHGPTLEVGSYNVNGSTRHLFELPYTGIDTRPGPGVDLVVDGSIGYYQANAGTFGVVVSTETLEHDPRPWVTVNGMGLALRPGGWCVLTARGYGFPVHDYPSDYWRFTPEAFAILLYDAGLTVLEVSPDPDPASPGVFAVALKP